MTGKIWGGMKKREECVGKNKTRKDVRRKGGGGVGETRGCHSTLHSDHKDHKRP